MWCVANLEEVDLNSAVAEVQDDGALGSEPEGEVGQSGQLVPFPPRNVGAGLQQVLTHVIAEIFQQRDLEGENVRIYTMIEQRTKVRLENIYPDVDPHSAPASLIHGPGPVHHYIIFGLKFSRDIRSLNKQCKPNKMKALFGMPPLQKRP